MKCWQRSGTTLAQIWLLSDTLIGHFNTGGRGLVIFHLANDYWNGCGTSVPVPCVPPNLGPAVDNRPLIDAESTSCLWPRNTSVICGATAMQTA